MALQSITKFSHSATNYIQTSSVYRGLKKGSQAVQQKITKVLDCVLPRNPVTQKREFRFLPTSVENALGGTYYNDVCPPYKVINPTPETDKVHRVFEKIVNECVRKDELKFELRIMYDEATVNAFCLPGGKVVITTAMLDKLSEQDPETEVQNEKEQFGTLRFEDKLAAVLGHEISHACAGHGRRSLQLKLISFLVIKVSAIALGFFIQNKENTAIENEKRKRQAEGRPIDRYEEFYLKTKAKEKAGFIQNLFENLSGFISYFAILSHGRQNELEADKYGIKIATKAGYRSEGAIWLQHKFIEMSGKRKSEEKSLFMKLFSRSIDLFSTHPPSIERLKANRVTVQKIMDHGVDAVYPTV